MSLAELRRELGISQAEMADALGKSQAATHKTEWSAEPLVSTLDAYVRALGRVTGEGATLELIATIGRHRVRLALPVQPAGNGDSARRAGSMSHPQRNDEDGLESSRTDAQTRKPQAPRSSDAARVVASLDPTVVRAAMDVLTDLVRRTRAAGRQGIIVDEYEVLGEFFTAFATQCGRSAPGGVLFGGRSGEPGLWHALQELCPIDDPNNWNNLRREIVADLIAKNRWERVGSSPRGSEFRILDSSVRS
jgi:hypothetical protein